MHVVSMPSVCTLHQHACLHLICIDSIKVSDTKDVKRERSEDWGKPTPV